MGLLDVFKKKEEKTVTEIHNDDLGRKRGQIEGNKDQDPGFNELDLDLVMKTVNEILPGTQMFVRDLFMPDEIAAKYEPERIIMERGFIDGTCRVMGMITPYRFTILSNHMADVSLAEHGTNWGLHVARANSHFKILDRYEYMGKTQILLLHLPDDERWELFKNVKLSIEDELIESSRRRFEVKSQAEVIPELATQEWLMRVAQPVGIDSKGNFYDLDLIPGTFDLDENIPESIRQQIINMDEALRKKILWMRR